MVVMAGLFLFRASSRKCVFTFFVFHDVSKYFVCHLFAREGQEVSKIFESLYLFFNHIFENMLV